MTIKEILIALLIHAVIPVIGLVMYVRLIQKMKKARINEPPVLSLGFIFMTYGGLLLVILTLLFWYWSGMASLSFFFLLGAAPIVMIVIAYQNFKLRAKSVYHKIVYLLSAIYPVIISVYLLCIWMHQLIS